MLDLETPINPSRLKDKQPERYQQFMACLERDAPAYADCINGADKWLTQLSETFGAKIIFRLGDLPESAQTVINEAAEHAAQMRMRRNDKAE